jgi:hypothetical protein
MKFSFRNHMDTRISVDGDERLQRRSRIKTTFESTFPFS